MRNTFRHDDTMIAVESQPATIAFDDLLAATRVIDDTLSCEAPWENWDGWEHTAKPPHAFNHADVREMQGYSRTWDQGERHVIQLPTGEDYGVYDYARANGASRQVAAELSAASRRQTIRQLVKWYEDGWQWYGVRCRFTALGGEFEASLWGIDDPEYAERDIKVEMALDVAGQLEKAGYTVTGRPEHRQGLSRTDKQERIRRNLGAAELGRMMKRKGEAMLTIRYYDRAKHKSIEIEIPADVVAVKIPPQEGQPALEVNVNTDAVLVDRAGPRRLGMLTYSDLLAEAEADEIQE